MTKPMKIDFVSDVVCPWCAIGLGGLEQALDAVGDLVTADIHFQPFELNPNMPAGGQNVAEHIAEKYGSSPEQTAAARERLQARAAEAGVTMTRGEDARIYNTFAAHRLLHWAELEGRQRALKHALFGAYFTRGENLDDVDILVAAAEMAGLDGDQAREVVVSGRYADEVRAAERRWLAAGVQSVPAVIINDKYLISGGQPAATFEQALRQIAAEG
jgi:predicted DsbA family dithiol-disulfide isomerase